MIEPETQANGDFDIGSENLRRQGRTSDLRPDAQEIADDSGPLDTESIEYSEPDNNASDPVALHTLAGIYILAEKYQLPELLALCLRKMSLCINLTADPTGFLDLALVIYKGTPDSDTVFRPYFREHCSAVLIELGKLEDEGEQTVNEYINEGGTFAKDIHSASWRLHRLQRDLEPDSRDIWFQSNDATEMARLTEIIESHVDFWRRKCQRLLMEHATYHPRCKSGLDDSKAKDFIKYGMDAHGKPKDTTHISVYEGDEDGRSSKWERISKFMKAACKLKTA